MYQDKNGIVWWERTPSYEVLEIPEIPEIQSESGYITGYLEEPTCT